MLKRFYNLNVVTGIIRVSLIFCFLLSGFLGFAQEKVDMADTMRSNGKIYVVVAVCLTILVGLFFYVFMLDRKMSEMEKRIN